MNFGNNRRARTPQFNEMVSSAKHTGIGKAKAEAKSEAKAAPTTDANAKAKSGGKDKPAGKKKKGE